jgi:hypothetical protein
MSKRKSPTQRSLEYCRKLSLPAYVTEQWIPRANIRRDAFGFGDVLVMDGHPGSLLVQACAASSVATRRTKILEQCTEHAKAWLQAGNRIVVWGWGQRVHRNKDGSKSKVKRWTLRVVDVTLGDFE